MKVSQDCRISREYGLSPFPQPYVDRQLLQFIYSSQGTHLCFRLKILHVGCKPTTSMKLTILSINTVPHQMAKKLFVLPTLRFELKRVSPVGLESTALTNSAKSAISQD